VTDLIDGSKLKHYQKDKNEIMKSQNVEKIDLTIQEVREVTKKVI
jgi:hypothetical protein